MGRMAPSSSTLPIITVMTDSSRSVWRAFRRPRRFTASALVVLALAGGWSCRGNDVAAPPAPQNQPRQGDNPFCDAAGRFVSRLGSAPGDGGAGRAQDPAKLWRELAVFLREAASSAPPEVVADAQASAAIVTDYYTALERAGFAAAGIPPETSAKLESPEFLKATTRLAEYSRSKCGFVG